MTNERRFLMINDNDDDKENQPNTPEQKPNKEKPTKLAYQQILRLFGGKTDFFRFIINAKQTHKTFTRSGKQVTFKKSPVNPEEMTVWAVDEAGWEENLTTFEVDMVKSDLVMFDWRDFAEFSPNSDALEFAGWLEGVETLEVENEVREESKDKITVNFSQENLPKPELIFKQLEHIFKPTTGLVQFLINESIDTATFSFQGNPIHFVKQADNPKEMMILAPDENGNYQSKVVFVVDVLFGEVKLLEWEEEWEFDPETAQTEFLEWLEKVE